MSTGDDEERLPPYCPFEPGATLKLQLHDIPGDSGLPLEVEVLPPFLPVSNGQALHVRLTAPHRSLPSTLLVKLFDRRFMERSWIESDNSWSPASELATRAAWRLNQAGAADDPQEPTEGHFFPDDPWLREKVPWMLMVASFEREREAYRRLAALQGTAIPKLFGTLSWSDPQLAALPPETHPMFAATPGLAVEFVEGETLRDAAERRAKHAWPTDAEERMSAQLLDIARALGQHGVIHDDIRSANIMLRSPSGEPVVIDFGRAVLRGEHETEREWTERLRNARQIGEFRLALYIAHMHDYTPVAQPPEPLIGYRWSNQMAERVKSPAKRLEWFEPVACEEPGFKKVLDPEDGGVPV